MTRSHHGGALRAAVALAALALGGGCSDVSPASCHRDVVCSGGRCLTAPTSGGVSYCAFPDSTCATGLRFDPAAPAGIAGTCATPPGDGGAGDGGDAGDAGARDGGAGEAGGGDSVVADGSAAAGDGAAAPDLAAPVDH